MVISKKNLAKLRINVQVVNPDLNVIQRRKLVKLLVEDPRFVRRKRSLLKLNLRKPARRTERQRKGLISRRDIKEATAGQLRFLNIKGNLRASRQARVELKRRNLKIR